MLGGMAAPSKKRVKTAISSSYVAFIAAGVMTATWAARIPQMKVALGMDAATWGLVLLSMAAGSVTALPLAGVIINRVGPKTTVRVAASLSALSLVLIGFGYPIGAWLVVLGLYLMGFGLGIWDVAINVHGAQVEKAWGKSIMAKFHAGYSVGTVAAALIGVVVVALGVSMTVHLVTVGLLLGVWVFFSVGGFLPAADEETITESLGGEDDTGDTFLDPADAVVPREAQKKTLLQVWTDKRTLAVGFFVLIFGFAEGAAIDWIGLGMIEDHETTATFGTLGLAVFLAFMTLARWFGSNLLDRYGRVPVLRVLTIIFTVGILLFVFAPFPWLAFVGAALWGVGASLGFPVGMSAGGDDQVNAALRVSVVASIGYVAFLGGPPLIGLIAQHSNVLEALLVVAAFAPIALLLAGSLREPQTDVAKILDAEHPLVKGKDE